MLVDFTYDSQSGACVCRVLEVNGPAASIRVDGVLLGTYSADELLQGVTIISPFFIHIGDIVVLDWGPYRTKQFGYAKVGQPLRSVLGYKYDDRISRNTKPVAYICIEHSRLAKKLLRSVRTWLSKFDDSFASYIIPVIVTSQSDSVKEIATSYTEEFGTCVVASIDLNSKYLMDQLLTELKGQLGDGFTLGFGTRLKRALRAVKTLPTFKRSRNHFASLDQSLRVRFYPNRDLHATLLDVSGSHIALKGNADLSAVRKVWATYIAAWLNYAGTRHTDQDKKSMGQLTQIVKCAPSELIIYCQTAMQVASVVEEYSDCKIMSLNAALVGKHFGNVSVLPLSSELIGTDTLIYAGQDLDFEKSLFTMMSIAGCKYFSNWSRVNAHDFVEDEVSA